jgi:hypothetical protein
MSSIPRSHDELEALIAADALHGLDAADHERMIRLKAEHGTDCAECLRLDAEYREVAGTFALIPDAVPMSAGAEDDLIRAARAPSAEAPNAGVPSVRPDDEEEARPTALPPSALPPTAPRRRWVAAAAIAAALVVLAGVIGYALAPGPSGLRTVSLQGADGGRLTLVYQEGQRDAVLIGSGVPQPDPGKLYELWYQPSEGAAMVPAGVFTPSDGSVDAAVTVGTSFVVVAVTAEPGPGGSLQPTEAPRYTGSA